MKPWAKLLIGLLVTVAVIGIAALSALFQFRNSAAHYREQLVAAGEKMELRDVRPEPVLPANNSASAFLKAGSLLPSPQTVFVVAASELSSAVPGKVVVHHQEPFFIAKSGSNSWEDVNAMLEGCRPALDLLLALPDGARIDFNLDYSQGATLLLPHLTKVRVSGYVLSTAVLNSLHRNDVAAAAKYLKALLTIVAATDDERLVISEYLRTGVHSLAVKSIWELLQSDNVADEQLQLVLSAWDRVRFLQPAEKACVMERFYAGYSIEKLRTTPDPFRAMGVSPGSKTAVALWRTVWSYDDELRQLKESQLALETLRRIQTNHSFHAAMAWRDLQLTARGLDQPVEGWLRSRVKDPLLEIFRDPQGIFRGTIDRVVQAETAKALATTAIRLKRHQLRHGNFPATLAAVVPEFATEVPTDPVDGNPMRYRLNQDGMFLLYSIGADGKDNGGSTAGSKGERDWLNGEDWVWPQAVSATEAEAYRLTNSVSK